MAEARQLSVLEKKVLLSFLEYLNDRFGNAGCNDYDLPNDPPHQKFMKRVIKTMYGPKDQQEELERLIESDKTILTMDTTVLGYIISCIERLPTQPDETAELPGDKA
jgi:hypothetical protein